MRFRYLFMAIGSALVLAALFLTDPLGGSMTVDWMLRSARFVMGVALVFYGYRAVTDYPEADGRDLHIAAGGQPTGAGLALVARSLTYVAMAIIFMAVASDAGAQSVRTYIPAQAPQHLPLMAQLQKQNFPDMPTPWMMAGQVEKESCITLTHSRCWNAKSRLKTSREEGAGFGQITRAYYASGKTRFDALDELRAKHPELAQWNWGNVYERTDLQLLAIVLKNRDNWGTFHAVKDRSERLSFALKSYNRGTGGVMSEIRVCGLTKGCDPQRFAGHAGDTCTASRKPLYGNRSACDISLAYVPGIEVRSPKYRAWFA